MNDSDFHYVLLIWYWYAPPMRIFFSFFVLAYKVSKHACLNLIFITHSHLHKHHDVRADFQARAKAFLFFFSPSVIFLCSLNKKKWLLTFHLWIFLTLFSHQYVIYEPAEVKAQSFINIGWQSNLLFLSFSKIPKELLQFHENAFNKFVEQYQFKLFSSRWTFWIGKKLIKWTNKLNYANLSIAKLFNSLSLSFFYFNFILQKLCEQQIKPFLPHIRAHNQSF